MRTLKILIKERESGDLSQTIKRVIAKIMRIYCELGLTLFRYTEYLISKNSEFSLML
jgi:hypothetical protein